MKTSFCTGLKVEVYFHEGCFKGVDLLKETTGFCVFGSEGAETSALCRDDPLRWEMRVLNLREVWYGGRLLDRKMYGHPKRQSDAIDEKSG